MSRVSKNIAFNLVGQILVVALGFWGTRLVFQRLGDEALGILYFALAINIILTPLLDFGISSTIVREVARHHDRDKVYTTLLSRTAALLYWTAYALLAVGIWFGAPWLVNRWLHLTTLDPQVAVGTLRLLTLALLLALPRSLYSNLLRGVERMEINNVIDVAMTAIRQGGTVLIVYQGGDLLDVACFYLGCFLLNVVAYICAAAAFFPWRAFVPGLSLAVVKRNAQFTVRVGAYTVLSMVQMNSDKAIMSKLLSVGLLGFYGVAQTTVERANQIPGAVMQAAFPKLSALFHEQDRVTFFREYRRLQDLVCYGMVPVFAAIIFASQPLFTYLLNAQAAALLLWPTVLLCLGWYMNGTLNMLSAVALAADRPGIGVRQNLYALFLITPPTALLIWKWSLLGAGISCVLYHLYAYAYGARRIAKECLGIRPWEWYTHVAKVLACAVLTYGIAWTLFLKVGGSSIVTLACTYLLGSLAFVGIAYHMVGKELRGSLIGWLNKPMTSSA